MATKASELRLPPLIAHFERIVGKTLTLEASQTVPMARGEVAKDLTRTRLTFRDTTGESHSFDVVRKGCAPNEVTTMRALQTLGAGACVPELLDAEVSDAPNAASWFVMPFYDGRESSFETPVPAPVADTLAKLHVKHESASVDWTWTYDGAHVGKLIREALAAIAATNKPTDPSWAPALNAVASAGRVQRAADTLPKTLTHGDMHPGNIILRDRHGPVIIDWGCVCMAPGPLDLANLVPLGSPEWHAYVEAYKGAGGALSEARLTRAWHFARAATGLHYFPFALEHRSNASVLIRQIIESDALLA